MEIWDALPGTVLVSLAFVRDTSAVVTPERLCEGCGYRRV